METNREEGWYWVSYMGKRVIGWWTMCNYVEGMRWYIASYGWYMLDKDLTDINENKIVEDGNK